MFETTISTLRGAGLHRYEVSNFARTGAECRHNLAYWRQSDWLAAGPSASAHVGGARWKNTPRLDDYLGFGDDGFARIQDHETPNPRRNLSERILTGLRLTEGLSLDALETGAASLDAETLARLRRAIARQRSMGALQTEQHAPSRLILTEQGFLVADAAILDLVGAVDP
jgi:oxygen-independent coproporphyrinogen-3 oxidase